MTTATGAGVRAPMGDEEELEGREPEGGEDESCEVEHEGRVYQIPKALQPALMMQADYTRKTQELGQHRRALEEDRAQVADHAQALHGTLDARAKLHAAEEQLAGYAGVDWDDFAQADPQGAQAMWSKYQAMAHTRDRYAWALSHHQSQAAAHEERALSAQITETGKVLSRDIEGWSPEVAAKLVDYAGAFGVSLEELREIADPRLWKILHRAHAGDEAAKQQKTADQVRQSQAVRPAVSVTGGAAPGGAVRDEMATAEWMKRRNEVKGRGR